MSKVLNKGFFIFFIFSGLIIHGQSADSLLNFISKNRSKASLFLKKNDALIAHLNEDKVMPLASTVKIIIAIEFAKQAGNDVFDENSYVSIRELDKYYLQGTDGNAHPQWLAYERSKGLIKGDSVRLIDVARGMIMFSSNANSEFLMDYLGFENIRSNLPLLGLKKQTTIYPLVASLFVYQNPQNYREDKIIKGIKVLKDEEYWRFIFYIHKQLKFDPNFKKKFRPQDLTMKMQKLWSDRLPAGTTKEYVQVATILNNRRYLGAKVYGILSEIMESPMENPVNQAVYKHLGMKGGSTPFVLTKTLYATYKDGTKIEMAYFFNDLTDDENTRLGRWMNEFELQVLTNEEFRKKVSATLR